MKKYIVILLVILIMISGIWLLVREQSKSAVKPNEIVLFYSEVCPHCAKVDAFLKADNIRSKVKFSEKEVSQNRDNLTSLVRTMQHCKIPVKKVVEVPLLWTGSECLVGDKDIIQFFKDKTK